jgi:hypothetical protein
MGIRKGLNKIVLQSYRFRRGHHELGNPGQKPVSCRYCFDYSVRLTGTCKQYLGIGPFYLFKGILYEPAV